MCWFNEHICDQLLFRTAFLQTVLLVCIVCGCGVTKLSILCPRVKDEHNDNAGKSFVSKFLESPSFMLVGWSIVRCLETVGFSVTLPLWQACICCLSYVVGEYIHVHQNTGVTI